MIKKIDKNSIRQKRKMRVRSKISGTEQRPRLNVFRSLNHMYAQIIDDVAGKTIVQSSTLEKEIAAKIKGLDKKEQAKLVGQSIAKKALDKGITVVVFDRAGYVYTGRVEQVAAGAREAGLKL